MKPRSEIAIIGAGPAGTTAAIQLRRMGFAPIVFEQSRVGGLLNNAYLIENYPGFPDGISGAGLVRKFQAHLRRWKVKVIKERVSKVIRNSNGFVITASRRYHAAVLIIASGTVPKVPQFDIDSVKKRTFFEIYPIRNVRNKRIVIIGAGDAALDYALNLCRKNQVVILNRQEISRGLSLLHDRIKESEGRNRNRIQYFNNTHITSIEQLNNCSIVQVSRRGRIIRLLCDYVVFAIGREPATDFLSPSIKATFPDGDGKGIYFIGDVRNGNLRQTAIAVGDGVKAAMRINQYLLAQSARKDQRE